MKLKLLTSKTNPSSTEYRNFESFYFLQKIKLQTNSFRFIKDNNDLVTVFITINRILFQVNLLFGPPKKRSTLCFTEMDKQSASNYDEF